MRVLRTFWIISAVQIACVFSDAATDYNKVNNDGSFSFGLSNKDIGGHYHEATGSADKIVRGRYGARSPANGRIEETVYTAGPRGFRARGPRIHRKMDLTQYPRGPIGAPHDPQGDLYEDPSYAFGFRTADHERKEDADSTGKVRGLYSYLDDVGERHTVRYAAGAGTGFEVLNAVPDSPANVAYSSPLYKAARGARGRMATVRGPDGQYQFIVAAPDHRRSESSGPDGIVRGSYSFLDDKGTQRTVQYIAGAGIGYRVVKSTTGPGSHLAPRPAIPELGIRDQQSNDLADEGYLKTSESGRFRPTDRDRDYNDDREDKYDSFGSSGENADRDRYNDGDNYNNRGGYNDRDRFNNQNSGFGSTAASFANQGNLNSGYSDNKPYGGTKTPFTDRNVSGDRRRPFSDNRTSGYNYNRVSSTQYGHNGTYNANRGSTFGIKVTTDRYDDNYNSNKQFGIGVSQRPNTDYPARDEYSPDRNKVSFDHNSNRNRPEYYDDNDGQFPEVSTDLHRLNKDRDRDWADRGRDSTVIKNVGKWYVGLPPGSAVRAHVQNIDLLPLAGRQPSPSEALRRDELASA